MLLRRAKQFAVIVGVWTAAGAFDGWEVYLYKLHSNHPLTPYASLLGTLPDFWIYAALTPAVLWFDARFRLRREKWARLVGVHLLAAVVFLLVWAALKVALAPADLLMMEYSSQRSWSLFRMLLIDNTHDSLWFYGAIVTVSELLHYQRQCRERETRAAKLESQLARAQLTALRMQLVPPLFIQHSALDLELDARDPTAADKTVVRLGDLLRMSVENGNDQEVTLQREMEFLEGYLDIQKTRLRDRLHVHLHLAPGTMGALVPNMILQPLVENAVKYGIASRSTPGHLEIRAEAGGDVLRLEITDDGPGMNPAQAGKPAKGLGIANTRARLQQLYGDVHHFSLNTPAGGGTQVRLEIPFRLPGDEPPKERLHVH